MKLRLLILLTLLCSVSAFASDENTSWTTSTSLLCSGTCNTVGRMKQVTFIFSTDFIGVVANGNFCGTAGACGTGSPADYSFTLTAQGGDTINSIAYTVTAGTIRIGITK